MSCPNCDSVETEEVSSDLDINMLRETVYSGSSFLLKISRHDHRFVAMNLQHEIAGEPVYQRLRLRYGFICNDCGYEWDVIWPSMLEVDGRRIS
jgi:hypothetical protein